MSRLDEGAKKSLITMQYFTDKYTEIIRERDKSFYDKNKSELDNFAYVIKRYTGYEYWFLNNFLREGKIEGFNEKELNHGLIVFIVLCNLEPQMSKMEL